ncbi:MAG: hypothetical protein R3E75_11960 [Steroidobacteraceae bacterium]
MKQFWKSLAIAFLALATHATAFGQAVTLSRPLPPSSICVDDVCSSPEQASSGGIKWNPGHYVRPDELFFIANSGERRAIYNTVRNVPQVRGALIAVPWGMIEKREGVYDWSSLDEEIEYLASMGKKVMIEVHFRKFGGNIPSLPQGNDRLYLPDYIIQKGWVGSNTDDVGGYSARLDIAGCMDRFVALFKALADRYDANPALEHVIASETSLALSDSGFRYDSLMAQQKRLLTALKGMFHSTHFSIMNNFMNGGGTPEIETREFTYQMVQLGVGVSVPDILPPSGGATYDNWNMLAYRGAGVVGGHSFGTTDLRGSVPSVANQEVIFKSGFTPQNLYSHAVQSYGATHIVWTAHGGSYGGMPVTRTSPAVDMPGMRWTDGVLPYLKTNNLPVRSACPTKFNGACRS